MLFDDLQLGDSGDNVRILQEKLKILGFYNAIITGVFELTTEVGVKAFQKEYRLPEIGVVDSETWQLLFDLTEVATPSPFNNYPILELGDSGSEVSNLQAKLKTLLYYTGDITGFFDSETQAAVKRFQFHNNLTTTGIVNNQTWGMLDTLYGNLNECVTGNEDNNYITYTVQAGDTLYAIARRYNTTVDAIKAANNLTSDILSIGQVLVIPTSEEETPTTTYTVQAGDTLYAIARRYNTTVDAIKAANNLTSDILSIGQVLVIPTNEEETPTTTYTVQARDTLYAIARRYNTTVDAIKNANNLTSNTLSIGQTLIIPTSNTTTPITYTVQPGDNLYAIARRYNTTVDAIKRANNLVNNLLSIGQILIIPN